MKKILISLAATCTLIASAAAAEDKAPAGKPDEAAMKKMMELTTPGEAHKVLNDLVGNWDYTMTHKMAKDAPEQTSTGTSENKWILDGRFLKQKVTGEFDMGGEKKRFEGIAVLGHDNVKGEYTSLWIDNMNTTMMQTTGKYDAATRTLTENAQFFCPMKNAEVKSSNELKFVDADHYTYTMYDVTTADKYKAMEIKYTRKKEAK